MVKNILAGVIGLLFLHVSYAGKAEDAYFEKHPSFSDTADKKDSLNDALKQVNDPKDQFKDLFIVNTLSNGIPFRTIEPAGSKFCRRLY
ncbi:MAG: hypothetical protein WDO16_06965 [Bacteroidota bacterium]